jgi:hypothetical protein
MQYFQHRPTPDFKAETGIKKQESLDLQLWKKYTETQNHEFAAFFIKRPLNHFLDYTAGKKHFSDINKIRNIVQNQLFSKLRILFNSPYNLAKCEEAHARLRVAIGEIRRMASDENFIRALNTFSKVIEAHEKNRHENILSSYHAAPKSGPRKR